MVRHLEKLFPAACDALGEPAVRRMIRVGIRDAAAYGIIAERGVCIYVDAMFAFGRDFDRELPWASAILRDRRLKNPVARADALFDAAFDHLRDARGISVEEAER
jgi:hypothetical protein